jgi:diaminohydroxyphosphoribosylaminopyrimidine deaminase/5-amino-6-(5-phosphoribosylamino)uracil reductase
MASPDGKSKWITGIEARKLAHALRADHDAVMVGGGTVRHDDPELTVRHVRGVNPARLILAPHSGIPPVSKLVKTAREVRTILVTAGTSEPAGSDIDGIELLSLSEQGNGQIDLLELLEKLPEIGILSVLIEGGSGVLSSFMQADLVDEIFVGIAPSVVGQGVSPFERFLPSSWEGRPRYCISRIKRYGEDVVITFNRPDCLCSQD